MPGFLKHCALLLLPFSAIAGQYNKGSWTLTVDETRGVIAILHARLGAVLENGRLANSTGWTVSESAGGISIAAKAPAAANWEIRATENAIGIQGSGALSGLAPAPAQRIPARLADAGRMGAQMTGKPGSVDYVWTGLPTGEKTYKAPDTPHVMYLALGPVDALNVHALFDRPTGIAIRFADSARLSRDPADPQRMQISTPLSGSTALITLIPDYFVKVLGMPRYVPYDDSLHKTAPTGWNHWLAFFDDVTEKDITNNADWLAANLKDYGVEHVQLDEGYQSLDHRTWVKDWDKRKFPHDPKWLADYIKSKGFVPGFWLVPYCLKVEAGKPEWFLRDEHGKIAMDYQGGGELDFSRPEVMREYWIPLMKTLKEQGWGYLKFDMGSAVPLWEKNRARFFDKSKTPYDFSVDTLKIFREILGPAMWHTQHPDNWGGRMGFVDVVGCGHDPGPGWTSIDWFFSVISNNTYQNHIVWYSDPDCIVLRGGPTRADLLEKKRPKFINLEEARTAASLLSIAGLQWLSGDDMPALAADRVELIKKSIPILPVFPIDLFGRGRDKASYPRILDLKVNMPAGRYDVVSVTNWSGETARQTVSFEKELGLAAGPYVVFDFWKEKLVGVSADRFETELPAHGTAVFEVHRLADHPQLIANSRHITGAFGIPRQGWEAASRTLRGTSETVPGARYTLFFHVPKGIKVEKVGANAANIEHDLGADGLLKVSFTGQKAPVDWSVAFAR